MSQRDKILHVADSVYYNHTLFFKFVNEIQRFFLSD